MYDDLMKKLDSLPPLPESIIKIENYKKENNDDVEDLILILEKDAFLVSTLLKVANSSMFGFRSKVETLSRLINLLGVKFTMYVAISETVQNLLTGDLKPYCIDTNDLKNSTALSVNLVNLWINKIDPQLKDELILPALLQQTGKIVLSEIIIEKDLVKEFQEKINQRIPTHIIEQELLGITTTKMTAMIFEHWKLSDNFIKMIEHVDCLEKCDPEYLKKAQILNIIKTVCTPKSPLNEENIEKAINMAKSFKLDYIGLRKAIEILQDRVLDAQ